MLCVMAGIGGGVYVVVLVLVWVFRWCLYSTFDVVRKILIPKPCDVDSILLKLFKNSFRVVIALVCR